MRVTPRRRANVQISCTDRTARRPWTSKIKSSTDLPFSEARTRDQGTPTMRAPGRRADPRSAPLRAASAPAEPARSRSLLVMAGLAVLLAGYAFIPADSAFSWLAYSGIGAACIAVAFWGYFKNGRRPRAAGWLVVLLGFLGWVVGDFVYMLEATVFHTEAYPAVSDVVYIASYV